MRFGEEIYIYEKMVRDGANFDELQKQFAKLLEVVMAYQEESYKDGCKNGYLLGVVDQTLGQVNYERFKTL